MASCHSRIGANTRHLVHACFEMNASNVASYWKRYVDSNRQLEQKCSLVKELIGIRDSVAIEVISCTQIAGIDCISLHMRMSLQLQYICI